MSSTDNLRWSEPNDATPFLPERRSLRSLREAAAGCRGCERWRKATQTVFGEGSQQARLMFVGEVPGDREDREGRPFIGPAGRELDKGLAAAGIDRGEVYVTNAVKHFSFEERGKRRMHKTPKRFEIDACRPWLDAELELVRAEALAPLAFDPAQHRRVDKDVPEWPDGGHVQVSEEAVRLDEHRHLAAVPGREPVVANPAQMHHAVDRLVGDLSGPLVVEHVER